MTAPEKKAARFTANFTILLAFTVALIFPIGYFTISYQYATGSLEAEAEINAQIVAGISDLNPVSWRSEAPRVEAMLARRASSVYPEFRRILDATGRELTTSGNELPEPMIKRSRLILHDGLIIGSIEITRSIRPILEKSALIALVGLGIGLFVFLLLPFRAISRANRQLSDSYNFLTKVMESSANAVIVVDLDGFIAMLNGRCTEMSGYAREELHGGELGRLFCEESRKLVFEQLQLVETGAAEIVKFETDLRRKDGSTVSIACGATPVYQEGQLAGVVLSIENITERRQAVEQLKSAKEYTENLIQAACVMILGLDLKGEVTLMNRTAEEVTGYRASELSGKNLFQTVMSADTFYQMCTVPGMSQEDGGRTPFESEIVTKNGTLRTISWRNSPIVEDGKVEGTLCFGIDITEHRKVEAQLRQSQKMESIGQLAGGVAHDFNNMLSVILGYAQICQLEVPDGSPLSQYIEEISKAGQRSRDMVRQLLAFSRKEIISPRALNLNAHFIETEKTLSRLIGEEVQLNFLPATSLWTVKIDPSQADQILINLAVNARDAMPQGGKLTIRTENVAIDDAYCDYRLDARPGQYARLTVEDTGIGMESELVKRIFEPFFTTKEVGKGTGLGLATVYGIVTQNGGFIDVESEPGKGTQFMIYLPKLIEEQQEEEKGTANQLTGSGTILVVEDDEMLRDMATKMLEKIGYQVIQADTPRFALSICQDREVDIDLVLSDVIMPEMNGVEMARGIAEIRPGTKILFMSGYSTDTIADRGILAQGMHYIQKPFDMEGLYAKILEIQAD